MTAEVSAQPTPIRGILLLMSGSAVLVLSDAITKLLTARYPVGQIICIRAVFTLIPILLLAWHAGGLHTLRIRNVPMQIVRAGCAVASSALFIAGLIFLPLADCTALAFSGPLFVTALATPMLGEKVGWRRWSAVCVGFMGVLIMLRPTGGSLQWAALLPVLGAVAGAFRDTITRKVRLTASPLAVLAFTMAAMALAGLWTLPFGWEPVAGNDLLLLATSGILLGGAQYLVIHAFYLAEASVIVPFKYMSLIWAALLGYAMWGDVPNRWLIVGAALVVGSGLYIMHRESRLARRGR
ncbi:MAG: DMT family transporter [Alphaproteobacteria bacterium]